MSEESESEAHDETLDELVDEETVEELQGDSIYILADRHGYNDEGVDTFQRDIVRLISEEYYGVELNDGDMKNILGEADNPHNVVEALESYLESRGIGTKIPERNDRVFVYFLGDAVCSRKPGEMKERNFIGKAAKAARELGVSQYDCLADILDSEEGRKEAKKVCEKVNRLTKQRFENLRGAEKYLRMVHIAGNADVLPSLAIKNVTPDLETLFDIYRSSGVFEKIVESPDLDYILSGGKDVGIVVLPYSANFYEDRQSFRQIVRSARKDADHILLTHETLDTNAVGDGRNVEGRELYSYAIDRLKPAVGFSGDTHEPTQRYDYKVGDHTVAMTQVSTEDVLRYEMGKNSSKRK